MNSTSEVTPEPTGELVPMQNYSPIQLIVALVLPPVGLVLAVKALHEEVNNKAGNKTAKGLVILLAALIGGAGYLFILNSLSANNKPYTYSQLKNFKLSGDVSGGGMSFKYPQEFIQTSNTAGNKDQAEFAQIDKKTLKKPVSIGGISAAISTPANAVSLNYINQTRNLMGYPSSKEYSAYVKPLKYFLQSRTSANMDINLGKPTEIRTAADLTAVTSAGWQFNFSAQDKTDSSNKIKGVMIFALSTKAYYYFFAEAQDSTWDANSRTWSLITSTYKIDQ